MFQFVSSNIPTSPRRPLEKKNHKPGTDDNIPQSNDLAALEPAAKVNLHPFQQPASAHATTDTLYPAPTTNHATALKREKRLVLPPMPMDDIVPAIVNDISARINAGTLDTELLSHIDVTENAFADVTIRAAARRGQSAGEESGGTMGQLLGTRYGRLSGAVAGGSRGAVAGGEAGAATGALAGGLNSGGELEGSVWGEMAGAVAGRRVGREIGSRIGADAGGNAGAGLGQFRGATNGAVAGQQAGILAGRMIAQQLAEHLHVEVNDDIAQVWQLIEDHEHIAATLAVESAAQSGHAIGATVGSRNGMLAGQELGQQIGGRAGEFAASQAGLHDGYRAGSHAGAIIGRLARGLNSQQQVGRNLEAILLHDIGAGTRTKQLLPDASFHPPGIK